MMKALRYLGRVSASAAGGLFETLVPRRDSAAERFFALDDVLVGDFSRTVLERRGRQCQID
jgi:hypothetical protein